MKTKSVAKILVVLTLAAALFAAFSPTASARGDGDYQLTERAPAQKEICILEGANICPPEPFEFVAPCITTSMLAGSECPVAHDTVRGDVGDLAAAPNQKVELGACIGVASCNDFIATCAGDGGTPVTILDGPKGQPGVVVCV